MVAAVWVAAVVAGLALGIVDAVVAAGTSGLADAGPDSWWIATTLISLTTGIGYGVAVGLVATTVTALVWRWRDRLPSAPHPRSRLAVVGAVVVLLLAVPVLVGAPAAAGPQATEPVAPTGGMERLTVLPAPEPGGLPIIGDVTGRQVILRGVNVNQLIDYHLRDPEVPATQPPTDDDFAGMAAMGFNVVRLGMSWSRLEPTRGELDEDYLDEVRAAVASAKEHGIYTVLDLHQDAWGNALARARAAVRRRHLGHHRVGRGTRVGDDHRRHPALPVPGAGPRPRGGDGVRQLLHRPGRHPDRARARRGRRSRAAFADEPAVAGYDLLNEPGIGASPPTTSGLLLGRYYDAALTAIRDAETGSRRLPPPGVLRAERPVVRAGVRRDAAARVHRRPAARVRPAPVQRVDHDGPELRPDHRLDRAEPHACPHAPPRPTAPPSGWGSGAGSATRPSTAPRSTAS